jgi:adenylate kinase
MEKAAAIVILLGPPGSGKGTQAAKLARETGLTAISTGELLRREADSASELGGQVASLLHAGLLVDDDLMNEVVAKRLECEDCQKGCILDGYPRTIEQARFLNRFLEAHGLEEPMVFDFAVSPEIVIERLSQRRQCPECGHIYSAEFDVYGKDMVCEVDGTPLVRRSDDNPETIRERLRIYQGKTLDLVSFYKARRYFALDAMQTPDALSLELLSLLETQDECPSGTTGTSR